MKEKDFTKEFNDEQLCQMIEEDFKRLKESQRNNDKSSDFDGWLILFLLFLFFV